MKKIINGIHSSKKAINDYNKKVIGFQDIQARFRPNIPKEMTMPADAPSMSLDSAMMGTGLPASYSGKQALAKRMGVQNYIGNKEQDDQLMMGLQGQSTNTAQSKMSDTENQYKEKDYALKERDMALKEKQIEAQMKPVEQPKIPTADDIASSLLKAYRDK